MNKLSFWEKDIIQKSDLIVIGSGLVGLSTAISFLERNPNKKVTVLERGALPSGASTKNAGFACFGSVTELLDDLNHVSESQMVDLVKSRFRGLKLLKARLGEGSIDFNQWGGYELIEKDKDYSKEIEYLNELLFPYFKAKVFNIVPSGVDFGFSKNHIGQIIMNQFEGQLHPGKMMIQLTEKLKSLGGILFNGVEVTDWVEGDGEVVVHSKSGSFNTSQLAICTNAFTAKLLPSLDIQPGRGQVVITQPIKDLKWKGTFHIEEGYYYFRNVGNRVLIGGGRNLAFEAENTTKFGTSDIIQTRLKYLLDHVILPDQNYEIDDNWSGIMAFGKTKKPLVKQISNQVFCGVRMGGMGVALGSLVGEELAALMSQK